MIRFDDQALRVDPPSRGGEACAAATSAFQVALMFRVLFSALVFVVGLASTLALVYAIVKLAKDGADISAIVTGVGGVLGGIATGFLVRRMQESIRVQRQALEDVKTYCGAEKVAALT